MRDVHTDRGGVTVGYLLMLPVLLVLAFVVIDLGRMLHAQVSVSEAASTAAQAVALGDSAAKADNRADAVFGGEDGAVLVDVTKACPKHPSAIQDANVTAIHYFRFVTPLGLLAGFLPGGHSNGTLTMSEKAALPCRS